MDKKLFPGDCPREIQADFDDIFKEILKEYSKENNSKSPGEYLKYSLGWHYILAPKLLELPEVKEVLDVGALFGTMSIFLAKKGKQVTAVDGYVDKIPDKLKLKYNLNFIFTNLESEIYPPFPENKFDLVLMSEILEHLNYNPVSALLLIRKTLKPGGYLVITTPDDRDYPAVPKGPLARFCHHLKIPIWRKGGKRQSFPHTKQYRYQEFLELLGNCGFSTQEFCKYEHEGIHMLAIARSNCAWLPSPEVEAIFQSQFPGREILSRRETLRAWLHKYPGTYLRKLKKKSV